MMKPNRTPEQSARLRERRRQADKDASFLFHYQMAQGMAMQEEEPLDRKDLYEEARKEKERLEEMARQSGKLRLDIESDADKEKTPPFLNPDEEQREEPLKK